MHDTDEEADSQFGDDDAAGDEELEEEGDAWHNPPSVEDLRSRWMAECRVVKALEKVEWSIGQGQSLALQAAQAARDRAERTWREALAPKPVAIRMGTAQRKLNRAQRAVDNATAAIQAFEDEVAQRREELSEALQSAEDRRDERRRELDELHKEAGDIAAAGTSRDQNDRAAKPGASRLLDEVVREVQAIVEALDEGSAARGRANLLLAKVATMPEDWQTEDCQRYSIGTDMDDEEGFQTVHRKGRGAQKHKGADADARGATWNETATGRWSRQRSDADAKAAAAGNAASAEAATSTARGSTSGAPAPATPVESVKPSPQPLAAAAAQATGRSAGGAQSGKGGRPAPSDQHDEQRPPKSHRGHDDEQAASVESACDDAARALKLRGEQETAIQAAQAANAKFGDETSMQIAGQLYAHKVQLAQDRAAAVGVEPTCNGVPLIQLPPEAFNDWIQRVLAPAERAKKEADEKEL